MADIDVRLMVSAAHWQAEGDEVDLATVADLCHQHMTVNSTATVSRSTGPPAKRIAIAAAVTRRLDGWVVTAVIPEPEWVRTLRRLLANPEEHSP